MNKAREEKERIKMYTERGIPKSDYNPNVSTMTAQGKRAGTAEGGSNRRMSNTESRT